MIHQHDQLPHDGCKGNFGGFSCGDEPLIKRFEQMIATAGRQGGHVESAAHFGSTTTYATLAGPLSTVAVIGAKPGQRGSLSPVELTQFWDCGQHGYRGDAADAGDFIQPTHLTGEQGLFGQQCFDQGFDFSDLFFQLRQPGREEFAQGRFVARVGRRTAHGRRERICALGGAARARRALRLLFDEHQPGGRDAEPGGRRMAAGAV